MTSKNRALADVSNNFGAPEIFGISPAMSAFLIVASIVALFAFGALAYLNDKENSSFDH